MPEPIDYVVNTAGFTRNRYAHSNGRKVQNPNAQVTALAIFDSAISGEHTTYDDMYTAITDAMRRWATKPGRRSKTRRFFQEHPEWTLHRYRAPMEFLRPFIEERWPDLTWVATSWVGAGTKLHLDEGVFGDDLVLARLSADQVVPIFNGVAQFPWDPNSTLPDGKSRMVYGYWIPA